MVVEIQDEVERGSLEIQDEIDWKSLERQFDNNGNGGGHDDSDGGHDWEQEPDDTHFWPKAGFYGGLAVGLVSGAVGTPISGDIMMSRYIKSHNIVTTSSTKYAVEEGIYNQAVNKQVELSVLLGPIVVLSALGTIIGHKIERRMKKKQQEDDESDLDST